MIDEEMNDNQLSFYNCTVKDGFIFTAIVEPINVHNAIVIRSPEYCDCWSPKVPFSKRSLSEHITYISRNNVEEALIIADSLDFLTECSSLKKLYIIPADTANKFDYSPLYQLNPTFLHCITRYGGSNEPYQTTIDYRKLKSLTEICADGAGHLHYGDLPLLERLYINDKKLTAYPMSETENKLCYLEITGSGLRNLSGISCSPLRELNLYYNYKLSDASDIRTLGATLQKLTIWNCPKVQDFSFLSQLPHLKRLVLIGSNKLPDVSFLNNMPELEYLKFSMEIVDGNLQPCLGIPTARCLKHKKHYNIRLSK